MSKLLSLRIRGIRSIGDEEHIIDFLDPLTIIQGPNGTGKTTCIEALNYITTGALPAGKLGSFIHNNKLANKNRVDALIQLKFISCDGREVVATKRMTSIVKPNAKTTTNKSDEYTLLIKDKFGNQTSLSSKVTDFNKEMANLLGVPKAILDYVMFCHQEESNWPLSEPKELKARFDAIFDVTRYVKAIDYVKKIIKELETEIKTIDVELPHFKSYIQDKINETAKLDHYLKKIDLNRQKIEENQQTSENLQVQLELIRQELGKMEQSQVKLEGLKTQVRMYKDQLNQLRNVPNYVGSADDLMRELNALHSTQDLRDTEAEQLRLEEEITRIDREIRETIRRSRELQNELNRATAEDMRRKELVKEKSDLCEQIYIKYGIIPDDDFNVVLLKRKSVMDVELIDFRKEAQRRQDEIGQVANKARENVASSRSMENMKKSELSKIAPALSKLEFELSKAETIDNISRISEDAIILEEPPIGKPRSKAYLDGFNDGFRMGYVKGYTEGYAEGRSEQNAMLRRNLDEKRSQKTSFLKELEEIRQNMPRYQAELRDAEQELSRFKQEITAEDQMKVKEINELDNWRQQMLQIETKLKGLKDNFEQVDALQRQMDQLTENQQALENKKTLLERRLSNLATKQNETRVLEDQLKKMEIQAKLVELEPRLADIQSQFQSYQEAKKKEHSLNNQCLDLEHLVQRILGEQGELSKRVDEIRRKLSESRYQDAQKQYRNKVIERVVRLQAIEDLNKYWTVVDETIIEFHQTKMEQINYILQDLWGKVYQGNDIETIKIKSENVGKDEKKKSYDYSVVMTIDGIDIDMRDRCSAGQKMLASILIRIALAEVFGGYCPILALDEPTTNLDIDKIDNIGDTLRRLIAHSSSLSSSSGTSQNKKNLQLIVITHDQRLVDHLYLACRPEYTYGLSKDEMGVSHIRMHKRLVDSQAFYMA